MSVLLFSTSNDIARQIADLMQKYNLSPEDNKKFNELLSDFRTASLQDADTQMNRQMESIISQSKGYWKS